MKRSNKWCQDKKLRRLLVKIDKEKRFRINLNKPSIRRNGWYIQYELSKKVKKSPIGKYLKQILYLLVEGDIIEDIKSFTPKFNDIPIEIYKKLTPGQKICLRRKMLEGIDNVIWMVHQKNPLLQKYCIYDQYYELDPSLRNHIIPVFFKCYENIRIYDTSPLHKKAQRDNLYIKYPKLMGSSRYSNYNYIKTRRRAMDKLHKKQSIEDIKEMS